MTSGYEIDAIDVAAKVFNLRSKNADESDPFPVGILGWSNPLKRRHGPLTTIGADTDDRA